MHLAASAGFAMLHRLTVDDESTLVEADRAMYCGQARRNARLSATLRRPVPARMWSERPAPARMWSEKTRADRARMWSERPSGRLRCGTCSRRPRAPRARSRRRSSSRASTLRAASAASANTPSASRPSGPSSSSTISSTLTVGGLARESVAALDAPLRADDASTAQHREQLLEKLHRHLAPARQLADRHRPRAGAAPELGEREHRVGRLARDRDHRALRPILRSRPAIR